MSSEAPPPVFGERGRLVRQLLGTLRLEVRRSLLGGRALAVYFLAFVPVGLVALWAVSPFPTREFEGVQEAAAMFAVIFEAYLRVSIFFSALFLFVNLYRAEILERSLHYYFLTPVRREVVAAGKYLAALAVACGLFVVSTTILFLLTILPWGRSAFVTFFVRGPGMENLLAYLGVVVLACAGYGAVFLVVGLLFRNPVVPAAVLWVWEAANAAAAAQEAQHRLLPACALPGAADTRSLRGGLGAPRRLGVGSGRRRSDDRGAAPRRLAGPPDGDQLRR